MPHDGAGTRSSSGRSATLVAAGILFSRVVGLLRQTLFAAYFSTSIESAAFNAAIKIPNFLQNLFGEGVLSASFIPIYARLLGEGRREEADKVAGAIFGLLSMVTGLLVLIGELGTPLVVDLIVGGLTEKARVLTIHLVRIIFPGTGFLVMSAWCLGVLNSHRKFFLSYAAPVAWNLVQIATMVACGRSTELPRLVELTAYAAAIGSTAQFCVQLPTVLKVLGHFRPSLGTSTPEVREVLRGFGPVLVGRGVVQISAYVDGYYASLISDAVYSLLSYGQNLSLLPVSLFGMAISAAELPEMSREMVVSEEAFARLRERINKGLERIAYFVVPSAAAFLFLGDVVAGTVLQYGKFKGGDTRMVWYLLMGSAVGLLAATQGRIYSSSFYALKDTRTPLYTATMRVVITAVLAYFSAVRLPGLLGVPRELGVVGITATTGVAAWIEFLLLRRLLTRRIGRTGLPLKTLAIFWGSAFMGAAVSLGLKWLLVQWRGASTASAQTWGGWLFPAPAVSPLITAFLVLIPFGIIYLGLTAALGHSEVLSLLRRRRRS